MDASSLALSVIEALATAASQLRQAREIALEAIAFQLRCMYETLPHRNPILLEPTEEFPYQAIRLAGADYTEILLADGESWVPTEQFGDADLMHIGVEVIRLGRTLGAAVAAQPEGFTFQNSADAMKISK